MTTAEYFDSITFHHVDERYYEVRFVGVSVGHVYHDSNAWSYAPWFIEGDRIERTPGYYQGANANRRPRKPYGSRNRLAAAIHLCQMQSSKVIAAMI